jgi:hypothetical protein
MRDPKAPILVEHVEQDPEKMGKLAAFKQRLRERYTIAPFQGPTDLALQVTADIPRALTSRPSIETLEGRLALLKSDARAWNDWRRANPDIVPDLSGVNLEGTDLGGVDLRNARLVGTNLNKANLARADLTGAVLFKATLRGANLQNAVLDQAQLIDLELAQADLGGASFSGTIIADVDLREVLSLASARHYGASTIGVDTLSRSEGRIPLEFLRGVRVPDRLIDYLPSLFTTPFQFYTCFLAYSQADHAFAERLYADLQANGVRAWFAPEDLGSGKRLHTQIDEAIRIHDRLVLILSEHSLKSSWVKFEFVHARKREEGEGVQHLLPISLVPFDTLREMILFDADTGMDLAKEIREYFIADFSNWKDHASYQSAFQRLLRDLHADNR